MAFENLTLTAAQDMVAAFASSPYYQETYRSGERVRLSWLCEVIERLAPGRVLDVGPGWGTMAVWLASHGWDVTVLDNILDKGNRFMTSEFCDTIPVRYVSMDIERDHLVEQFDLVLMTLVIAHLRWRPDNALQHVKEMVDNKLICSELWPWGQTTSLYGGKWHDIPVLDTEPESTAMVTCLYTPETYEELMRTAFNSVSILIPDTKSSAVMYADCSL